MTDAYGAVITDCKAATRRGRQSRTVQHGCGELAATGDIDEMWIRDSAVQVAIYLPAARGDPGLRGILEGVILRQAFYVLQVRRSGCSA